MSSHQVSPRRTPSLQLTVLAPVLALIALISWGLASPVGSTPDDDFHLASIWCSESAIASNCSEGTRAENRSVPSALVTDAYCYTRDSEASASCQEFDVAADETLVTGRGNFYGLYPEVFYWVMGLLAGPNIPLSVLGMRILNSVLLVGLVGGLAALLPRRHRFGLLLSVAVTVVPLGMFLVPSTNPSSWAIISAAVLLYSLLGYFDAGGKRKLAFGAFATAATIMGAGARADSAVYAGIAIAVSVLLTFKPQRRYLPSAVFPAILVLVALGFYLSSSQGGEAAAGGLAGGAAADDVGLLVWVNGLNVPDLWAGALGGWALGWFDTELPAIVSVAAFACFAGLCFIGLSNQYRGKIIAALIVGFVLYAFPLFLLVQSGAFVGSYVQPRYTLPLMIILAGIVLLRSRESQAVASNSQMVAVAVALSLANAAALHTNIRRYVTGSDIVSWNLDLSLEWWWEIPASPMFVWLIGSAAFAGLIAVVGKFALQAPKSAAETGTPRTLDQATGPVGIIDAKPSST